LALISSLRGFAMAATIPLEVTPEERAILLAQAEAQGVTVDALVRKALVPILYPAGPSPIVQLRGDELSRAFEELSELVPASVPPLPAESLRRENLYSREDDR
jgi:hypothetical protein